MTIAFKKDGAVDSGKKDGAVDSGNDFQKVDEVSYSKQQHLPQMH